MMFAKRAQKVIRMNSFERPTIIRIYITGPVTIFTSWPILNTTNGPLPEMNSAPNRFKMKEGNIAQIPKIGALNRAVQVVTFLNNV